MRRRGLPWLDALREAALAVRRGGPKIPVRFNTVIQLSLLFAVVWLALAVSGVFAWRRLRAEVSQRAAAEASLAVGAVVGRLEEADRVYGAANRAETAALRDAALAMGPARPAPPVAGAGPGLTFGKMTADGQASLVDGVALAHGGQATLYAASNGAWVPIATSLRTAAGARVLDVVIEPHTQAGEALAAGRVFSGLIDIHGRPYYARLEPMPRFRGASLGAWGAMQPLQTLDEIDKEIANSPYFAHGFLALADGRGRLLFAASHVSPAWLALNLGPMLASAETSGDNQAGYSLTRASADQFGVRIVAGVYGPDLTQQTQRTVGSFGFIGMVIVLALCLAWLLARRLTDALTAAESSRSEAERARAEAEAAGAALNAELAQAARYVELLLPQRTPQGQVAADWLYLPSVGVGGDAFGYLWLDEGHFAFYLLDVCGHGVGAALLATTVMNVIRSRSVVGADFGDPSTLLTALNAAFPMDAQNGMYFTIWYGVYDTATATVRYAAAGHHPAVLVVDGERPTLLQGRGLPVGCFEDVEYPTFSVAAPPGARLYVFSDGIFEVELKNHDDMLTFEAFVDILMDWRERHADRELAYVLETVQEIQGKPAFDDDCALIELAFGPLRAAPAVA